MKIKEHLLPPSDWGQQKTEKKSICIHHTVSGPGIEGDIATWKKPGRIATHFIIERDGTIVKTVPVNNWAHHLGITSDFFKEKGLPSINTRLNMQTIGIELDSWGPVKPSKEGYFTNRYGAKIPKENVVHYPDKFRGYSFYEKYTDEQLKSLRWLLLNLCSKHRITNSYNEDMWDVSIDALKGAPGIWNHTSYRDDKSDCHPQKELKTILQTLILSGPTS